MLLCIQASSGSKRPCSFRILFSLHLLIPEAANGRDGAVTTNVSPPCRLTLEEKVTICSSVGEEVLQESDLRNLLDKKKTGIIAYDGFEPSGRMHIAQVTVLATISAYASTRN